MNETKTPYYAPKGFFKHWQLHEAGDGCMRVDVVGAVLQTHRAPPLAPVGPSARPAPASTQAGKQPFKMLLDIVDTAQALSSPPAPPKPPAPKPATAAAPPANADTRPVYPFDMQDIAPAMDRIGWTHAAKLMRRFFAGALNYSKDKDAERAGINQCGDFYAPEFVDTTTVTWKWLLEYPTVVQALAQLVQPGYLASVQGKPKMGEKIMASVNTKYPTFMGEIDALADCKGDVFALHRRFQFQLVGLDFSDFLNSDLGAALGNFSIYAAIAYATVKRQNFGPHTVTVTHVYAYAKDNFSFNDDDGPSQYLGHWNKQGVIFVPSTPLIEKVVSKVLHKYGYQAFEISRPELRADPASRWVDGADFTVQTGEAYKAENVFYPLRNRHFTKWQADKQRGGNVLVFSDLQLVRLAEPVTFNLPPL